MPSSNSVLGQRDRYDRLAGGSWQQWSDRPVILRRPLLVRRSPSSSSTAPAAGGVLTGRAEPTKPEAALNEKTPLVAMVREDLPQVTRPEATNEQTVAALLDVEQKSRVEVEVELAGYEPYARSASPRFRPDVRIVERPRQDRRTCGRPVPGID
jgi:hypothetical protein